ncbi:hypothetical protein K0M31_000596 [Melipona bicolor]|uniref:Uncharacterized protein n=1 Tax=Melipona bicolor TaxID=60889 RepID=A0AA40GE54_9HYME|nr:hypothetical protein K0M31_000596 [Melipona bicolor]
MASFRGAAGKRPVGDGGGRRKKSGGEYKHSKKDGQGKRIGRGDAAIRGIAIARSVSWEGIESQPEGPSHLPENRKKTAG